MISFTSAQLESLCVDIDDAVKDLNRMEVPIDRRDEFDAIVADLVELRKFFQEVIRRGHTNSLVS